jgi:hypothetical protein
MATYYKYAERSADSQVNWAEVGKSISDMLKEETAIREQKKAAIDQATREFQKTLENAPQGQFQDGNKFTNDYAHSMMEQQMIDNRLLKSGQMKLQDYTYRRQNYVDGTSTLFDLQKLYQENYKKKMDGIQSGELQALTGANMASVEGFADFSKSKAVIDPSTGVINVGIMKPNATTGVMELTNDVAPVNVIKGKILADIPAFKVEEAMNNTVKNLGVSMDYIYQAATKTGAGTVTKLLGVGALQGEAAKHPEFKDSIDKANAAINSTIDSYFANDYNISSVLTQNTGKYSQESFTYDKDVAAKDKSKILLKINQTTGLPIIDKSGSHYKEQEQEARQWVRTQLLGKIDDKREIDVTGTIPYGPQPQQWQYQAGQEKKNELAAAGAWNQLYTGKTAAEKKAAADILLGTPNAQAQGLLGVDVSTPGVVKLNYADSKKNRTISMLDAAGKPISLFDFAGTGVELHGVVDRQQAVKAGGGGTGYGALKPEEWRTVKSLRAGETAAAPVVNIMPELFTVKSVQSSKSLQSLLGPTFKVNDIGGTFGNDVEVIAPNGQRFTYNANSSKSEAAVEKANLEQFIKVNGAPTGGGGITGGNVR